MKQITFKVNDYDVLVRQIWPELNKFIQCGLIHSVIVTEVER